MENNIELLCLEKEHELLNKYFPEGLGASDTGSIGDYTIDLPIKIEGEFREFLVELWKKYSDKPLALEEQTLRRLITDDDREAIGEAYKNARRVTPWERIAGTNHRDVAHYKGLLREYTKDLLMVMRIDFLEEITGNHINCKSFPD